MGCNSGSVDDAAKANIEAKKAVKKLQDALEHDKDSIKAKFFAEIDDSFANANITDGRQIGYSYDIKTEYTSEFSLDKISGPPYPTAASSIATIGGDSSSGCGNENTRFATSSGGVINSIRSSAFTRD